MDALHQKLENLKAYFRQLGSAAIAFSGGVDSTFMLAVATETLTKDDVLAVTIVSDFIPEREKSVAENFCSAQGIRHIILPVEVLSIEGVAQNPVNRCYLCKRSLFAEIKNIVAAKGLKNVCEGSNVDDLSDYRPGMKAIAELGIKSPLRYAQLTKQDIRDLSKEMGLSTWDKPSFACLASRFAYGEQITTAKLKMVEKAENFLLDLGFRQLRVRLHGKMARLEVLPEDFGKIITMTDIINNELKELGFSYVALDLGGFRSGSMNDEIAKESR